MTKEEAYHNFLTGLGLTAYSESTVPESAPLPRVTYTFSSAEFGNAVAMAISVWDRSNSWASVTAISDTIYKAIGLGGKIIPYDEGYLWIRRGQPFAQRMSDEDDTIRRIYINVEVEYLTAL